MALEIFSHFNSVHNVREIEGEGVPPAFFTLASTINALSPEDAFRWGFVDGSGAGTNYNNLMYKSEAVTPKRFSWFVLRDYIVDGIPASDGKIFRFGVDGTELTLNLEIHPSGSDYVIRFTKDAATRTLIGDMTTTQTDGARGISIRGQMDGYTLRVWHEGSDIPELVAPFDGKLDQRNAILRKDGMGASNDFGFASMIFCHSDDEYDRPGYDVRGYYFDPTGDDYSGEYHDEDCAGNDAGWADVDLGGGSGRDDDQTIYFCGLGGQTAKHRVTTTNRTLAAGHTAALKIASLSRTNLTAKTVTVYHISYNGTTEEEVQLTNLGSTNWGGRLSYFETDPDGNAWDTTAFNNFVAGLRTVNTNGANDEHAVLIGDAISVDNDPPARREAWLTPDPIVRRPHIYTMPSGWFPGTRVA